MNLSRALTSLLSASSKQRLLRSTVVAIHPHPFSTKAPRNKTWVKKDVELSGEHAEHDKLRADPIMDLKRPSEIPFQSRVANTVQLIGTIGVPVQKQTLADGRVAAVSVLTQEKYDGLPKLWIPIIFQGELAEVAAAYLKENDVVHIAGQLNGDTEPVKVNKNQAIVQVLAHTLNYVVDSGPDSFKRTIDAGAKIDALPIEEIEDSISYTEAEIANDLSSLESWSDLFMRPDDWYDNRAQKTPGDKTPHFKHKKTGKPLSINKSTPNWVVSKLLKPPFRLKNPTDSPKWDTKKTNSSNLALWDDLVANPQNWADYRMDKKKGSVKPKFPDFKNKVTKEALWIDTAPSLILGQLDRLKSGSSPIILGKPFSSDGDQNFVNNSASKSPRLYLKDLQQDTGRLVKAALWKDLVDNPKNWWDNRSKKFKPSSPDFKHKENGEALWINKTTPQWVLEKLGSQKAEATSSGTVGADSDIRRKSFNETLLS